MIKAVVSDLDGTILHKRVIGTNNLKALALLKAKDIDFVIATGRSYSQLEPFFKEIGYKTNAILLNGGCFVNKEGQSEFENNLDFSILEKCQKAIEKANGKAVYYSKDLVYSFDDKQILKTAFQDAMIDFGISGFGDDFYDNVIYLNDIKELENINILKIEVMDIEKAIREACIDNLKGIENIDVNRVMPYNVEINSCLANKGAAIRMYCKLKNLDISEVACFGDSENDIAMFEVCSNSYCMSTGSQSAKAKAGFIAKDENNDGFYQVIKDICQ